MLRASPQKGVWAAFSFVRGFQAPIGPAWTSGGLWKDCTIAAETGPRRAAVKEPRTCGPDHSVAIAPLAGSTLPRPKFPSTCSVNRISPDGRQWSAVAEAFMPGVRFFGSPPERETA